VAMGGRTTSTLLQMTAAFGMLAAPRTPMEMRAYNRLGLAEAHRVLRKGGRLLTKCQDYISSGQLQPGTHWTIEDCLTLGFRYEDRFEHVTQIRPQPPGRRQVHARRNLSTLLVFTR
jgi:hypothetical protein